MTESTWVDALSVEDLPTDDAMGIVVAGRDITIYTVSDAVYASDSMCTHGQAHLCDGFLDGHEIECPLHQGKFDVRDGKATCEPATVALRTYPVRIEALRVYLRID